MTHLEIYEAVLSLIDKVKAPVLYVEQYNVVINMAIENVVKLAYKISDDERRAVVLQDDTDGIQVLEKPFTYLPGGLGVFRLVNNVGALPADYYHLRSCVAVFKPVKGKSRYAEGYRKESRCHRMTGNTFAVSRDDYYSRPSLSQVYAQVANNEIRVHYGEPKSFELEKVTGFYVKRFTPVALAEDPMSPTFDILASSSKASEFPDETNRAIVQEAVKIILDINQNPRLQNQLALNQN